MNEVRIRIISSQVRGEFRLSLTALLAKARPREIRLEGDGEVA
jgi:hypothetical protein